MQLLRLRSTTQGTVCCRYEDPAWAEERYMEGPDAWGDEWPENPPIYEAVDM